MNYAAAAASMTSCSSTLLTNNTSRALEDHLFTDLVSGCHIKPELAQNITGIEMAHENKDTVQEITEDFNNTKQDSLVRLKDSTKKLLNIIEELQSKTRTSSLIPITHELPKLPSLTAYASKSDLTDAAALKKLEAQSKNLDVIYVEVIDNDCSVYKRLTRKCNCLNRKEFNDFMIHFNEDTKYLTSDLGEIIKNTRILKKFLYMGSGYTKNALVFINEGLTKSSYSERVEMILACSHADFCNVFDNDSMVVVCILWPCKYQGVGDHVTQSLAARVLYRIAVVEEGRRYLNFNSKITNDIKKVLRKNATSLDIDTLEFLNCTLNLLSPSIAPHINATYYCKADEGMMNKILNALAHFRLYMTLEEILNNLDLLNKLSNTDKGKQQLKPYLPTIFKLFKRILMEYDDNEINILLTSIMNNLMLKPMNLTSEEPKTFIVSDIATEPIPVKNQILQVPSKKNIKKVVKSRLFLNTKQAKNQQQSIYRDLKSSVIVVPIKSNQKVKCKSNVIFVENVNIHHNATCVQNTNKTP